MSSTLLELMRHTYEQSEQYELAIGEELDKKPNGQKAKVWQQHNLKGLTSKIIELNSQLIDLQTDQDGLFRQELTDMREGSLNSFYTTLQTTKEYYEKFPSFPVDSSTTFVPQINVQVDFSGEEIFGKYLDLNPLFQEFSNFMKKKNNQIEQDYLQYLDRFTMFFYIPEDMKAMKGYYEYLSHLWNYLVDFYQRVHPLISLEKLFQDWEVEFQQKIKNGDILIYQKSSSTDTSNNTTTAQPLRLGMFNTVEELEALGLERLKEGLEALGLKCGGSLSDRAKRLWSIRGKKPEEFPANLKSKPTTTNHTQKAMNQEEYFKDGKPSEQLALLEFKITSLCEVMGDIISATRRHTEKQQARSLEEKQQEIMEEEYGLLPDGDTGGLMNGGKDGKQDDDEEEGPLYNPLNLPLGWDGKPIPYWLYKLHGLGVEYKCEICGNQSYWGRRAFDRHFQEWKHAHGMRCLGIPNTKHFHDITSIDDVITLYGKIKDQLKDEEYLGELEEEFEDTQGNILNRRTYEDLARQGLL